MSGGCNRIHHGCHDTRTNSNICQIPRRIVVVVQTPRFASSKGKPTRSVREISGQLSTITVMDKQGRRYEESRRRRVEKFSWFTGFVIRALRTWRPLDLQSSSGLLMGEDKLPASVWTFQKLPHTPPQYVILKGAPSSYLCSS